VKATEEAIASGAMALFGEKYGDTVRVVAIPPFSKELCGGTHCKATGDIGLFTIVSEGGVAAGVRRIEALTGEGALSFVRRRLATLDRMLAALNVPADQGATALEKLQQDVKRLQRELREARASATTVSASASSSNPSEFEIGPVRLVTHRVKDFDKETMRQWADNQRERIKSGVVVLASENDAKVSFVVAVTRDLTSKVQAGQVVKRIAPIVGGGGGGRPDFAEAGGKDVTAIDSLLAESRKVVEQMVAG
jgi:alanyl-tRNA synthetase